MVRIKAGKWLLSTPINMLKMLNSNKMEISLQHALFTWKTSATEHGCRGRQVPLLRHDWQWPANSDKRLKPYTPLDPETPHWTLNCKEIRREHFLTCAGSRLSNAPAPFRIIIPFVCRPGYHVEQETEERAMEIIGLKWKRYTACLLPKRMLFTSATSPHRTPWVFLEWQETQCTSTGGLVQRLGCIYKRCACRSNATGGLNLENRH